MEYGDFKNTLREWVRTKITAVPELASLPLVVTNEGTSFGVNDVYLRYSVQTGDAQVIGVGTAIKRRRRIGRVFIEVFGPVNEGDGVLNQLSTKLEKILRDGSTSGQGPHKDITLGEPSTFERPEGGRYCQVVNSPIQVDHFS